MDEISEDYIKKIDLEVKDLLPDIIFSDESEEEIEIENLSKASVTVYERPENLNYSFDDEKDIFEEVIFESIPRIDEMVNNSNDDEANCSENESSILSNLSNPAEENDEKLTVKKKKPTIIPFFCGIDNDHEQLREKYLAMDTIQLNLGTRGELNLDDYLEKDLDSSIQNRLPFNSILGHAVESNVNINNDSTTSSGNFFESPLVKKLKEMAESYSPTPAKSISNKLSISTSTETTEPAKRGTVFLDLRKDQTKVSVNTNTDTLTTRSIDNAVNENETRLSTKHLESTGLTLRQQYPWSESEESHDEDERESDSGPGLWIENYRRMKKEAEQNTDKISNEMVETSTTMEADQNALEINQKSDQVTLPEEKPQRPPPSQPVPAWVEDKIRAIKERENRLAERRQIGRRLIEIQKEQHNCGLPVLFDENVSFGEAVCLLPNDYNSSSMLELVIRLSSPGCLLTKSKCARLVDDEIPTDAQPMTFAVLLMWLSSLTLPLLNTNEIILTDDTPPFHITSMETRACTCPQQPHGASLRALVILNSSATIASVERFLLTRGLPQVAGEFVHCIELLCRRQNVISHVSKMPLASFIKIRKLEENTKKTNNSNSFCTCDNVENWTHSEKRSLFWTQLKDNGVLLTNHQNDSTWPKTHSTWLRHQADVSVWRASVETAFTPYPKGEGNRLLNILLYSLLGGLNISGVRFVYSPILEIVIVFRGVRATARLKAICGPGNGLNIMRDCNDSLWSVTRFSECVDQEIVQYFGPRLSNSTNAVVSAEFYYQLTSKYPSCLLSGGISDMLLLTSSAISDIGWMLHLTDTMSQSTHEDIDLTSPELQLQLIGVKRIWLKDNDLLSQYNLPTSTFTGICHLLLFRGEGANLVSTTARLIHTFYTFLTQTMFANSNNYKTTPASNLFFSCLPGHLNTINQFTASTSFYQLPDFIHSFGRNLSLADSPRLDDCDKFAFVVIRSKLDSYQLIQSIVMDQCAQHDLLALTLLPNLPDQHDRLLIEIFGSSIKPPDWIMMMQTQTENQENQPENDNVAGNTMTIIQPAAIFLYRGVGLDKTLNSVHDYIKTQRNVVFAYTMNNTLVAKLSQGFFRQSDIHSHPRRRGTSSNRGTEIQGNLDIVEVIKASCEKEEMFFKINYSTISNPLTSLFSVWKLLDSHAFHMSALRMNVKEKQFYCLVSRVNAMECLKEMIHKELHSFPIAYWSKSRFDLANDRQDCFTFTDSIPLEVNKRRKEEGEVENGIVKLNKEDVKEEKEEGEESTGILLIDAKLLHSTRKQKFALGMIMNPLLKQEFTLSACGLLVFDDSRISRLRDTQVHLRNLQGETAELMATNKKYLLLLLRGSHALFSISQILKNEPQISQKIALFADKLFVGESKEDIRKIMQISFSS